MYILFHHNVTLIEIRELIEDEDYREEFYIVLSPDQDTLFNEIIDSTPSIYSGYFTILAEDKRTVLHRNCTYMGTLRVKWPGNHSIIHVIC